MTLDTRVIRLADGRDLAWMELGDPAGAPVFIFHGSPGSAREFAPVADAAVDAHVRLLSVDRPGYGHSSRHPSQTFADFAGDVAQLADHLTLDTFAVAGHSSGAPNAAACARFLPRRVTACGIICGPAPPVQLDYPGLSDGMLTSNRILTALSRRWPASWDRVAVGVWTVMLPVTSVVIARARKNGERSLERFTQLLPAPDVEVMARPAVHAQALDFVERFTPADGRTGIQDMAMGARDWGFGLEDITVPVDLWHGDLDRNIPIAHAELQASLIPNATLHRCPGEGHSLHVDHMREILETLMTAAPPRR